jgi:hypothetical protein
LGIVNIYSKVLAIDTAKGLLKLANSSGFGQYVGYRFNETDELFN